jgi:hypothetical protein
MDAIMPSHGRQLRFEVDHMDPACPKGPSEDPVSRVLVRIIVDQSVAFNDDPMEDEFFYSLPIVTVLQFGVVSVG